MKKRIFKVLGSCVLLLTITAVGAYAQSREVYWGQDYDGEDCTPLPGMSVFYHEPDEGFFRFTLYKDGTEVFSNLIEEGTFNDDEGFYEEESVFLEEFSKHGSGAYTFKVSTCEGSAFDLDNMKDKETYESGVFNYTQPSEKLALPKIISNKDGEITWGAGDSNTYAYLVDKLIDYGNGFTIDPDYSPEFVTEDYTFYNLDDISMLLDYYQRENSKAVKANAKVKIRFLALPEDIREFQPSEYTDFITINGELPPYVDYDKPDVKEDFEENEVITDDIVDTSAVSPEFAVAAGVVHKLGLFPQVYALAKEELTLKDAIEALGKIGFLEKSAKLNKNEEIFTDTQPGTMINGYAVSMMQSTIRRGSSAGTFGIDEKLTYQTGIQILLNSFGYAPHAEKRGMYPHNYLSLAAGMNMLTNINLTIDSVFTGETFAQLLYNSLDCNILELTEWSVNGAKYEISQDTVLTRLGLEMPDISEFEVIKPDKEIKLTIGKTDAVVNGESATNDAAPIIVNDRTMLPIRFIAEALGAKVEWNEITKTVNVFMDGRKITLIIGKDEANVDGRDLKLDVAPFIENGRTYLPVRFVAENLGAKVNWNADTKTVTITK